MAERRRGSFGPTVLLGLASAALAAVGSHQTWASATAATAGPGRTSALRGSDAAPLALSLALVLLAAWGVVLVVRRRTRRVVAVLGLLAAVGVAVVVATTVGRLGTLATDRLGDPSGATTSTTAWPWVALAAAVVTALCFGVALRRAGEWPEMSSRYDAPAAAGTEQPRPTDSRDVWRALDEGRDPTA